MSGQNTGSPEVYKEPAEKSAVNQRSIVDRRLHVSSLGVCDIYCEWCDFKKGPPLTDDEKRWIQKYCRNEQMKQSISEHVECVYCSCPEFTVRITDEHVVLECTVCGSICRIEPTESDES